MTMNGTEFRIRQMLYSVIVFAYLYVLYSSMWYIGEFMGMVG